MSEQRRATTSQRGYGARHQRFVVGSRSDRRGRSRPLRALWEPILAGEPFDLGHDDFDRGKDRGRAGWRGLLFQNDPGNTSIFEVP